MAKQFFLQGVSGLKGEKLNLCCGTNTLRGWLNVDLMDCEGVFKADLNKDWGFISENSVSEIRIIDGLEHLDSVEHFLMQCERVLKPRGIVFIRVPHYSHPSAYRLSHKHLFSWDYWSIFPEYHDRIKLLEPVQIRLVQASKLVEWVANICPKAWERVSVVRAIEVKLKKIDVGGIV